MSHLKPITKHSPAKANEFQEAMCKFAVRVNAFLELIGGTFSVTTYVENKCDLPPGYFD